jgi:hypothetical protein
MTIVVSTILQYQQMDSGTDEYRSLCLAQGISFQFFAVCFNVYWVFIGFVTYLVVVRRRSIRSLAGLERQFHLLSWPFCLLVTLVPVCLGGIDIYGPESGIAVCYFQVPRAAVTSLSTLETHLFLFVQIDT